MEAEADHPPGQFLQVRVPPPTNRQAARVPVQGPTRRAESFDGNPDLRTGVPEYPGALTGRRVRKCRAIEPTEVTTAPSRFVVKCRQWTPAEPVPQEWTRKMTLRISIPVGGADHFGVGLHPSPISILWGAGTADGSAKVKNLLPASTHTGDFNQ